MKVCVVVPTLSNKEGGYEALASIKPSYDVWWMPIIISNWVEPRSVSASWNIGIEVSKEYNPDFILIINDDILFSPWTLDGLINVFKKPPCENLGMVTALNLRGTIEPHEIFNVEIPETTSHSWAESPDFSCFMARPELFQKVGPFDENFRPAYFEDNDYHYRMTLHGYKAISSSLAPYYHYGSVTQNENVDQGMPVVNPIEFQENQAYYTMKWGGSPGHESFVNPYNDSTVAPSKWKLFR